MFSFNHGVRAISFTVILAVSLTACGESPFGEKSLIGSTVDGKEVIGSTEDGGLIYEEEELTGLHTTEYGEWTGTVADDPAVVTVEMSILGVPIKITEADVFVAYNGEVISCGNDLSEPMAVGAIGEPTEVMASDCMTVTAGEPERMSWDNLPLVWDQASGMDWGCRREPISLLPGSETTIDCTANAQFDQVMACSRSLYSSYNADTGAVGELIDLTEFDHERVYVENGYLPQSETFPDLDDFQIVGDQLEFLPNDEGFEMVASIISSQSVEIHYWAWSHYTEMFCLPVSD